MPTVFVTGASRGIGLELARRYAAAGWTVLAGVRDPAGAGALKAVASQVLPLEVQNAASVAAVAKALEGTPIDLLINNAGVIGPRQSTLAMDFDAFEEVLAINTLGPLRVTDALLPNLRLAKPAAKIAVISSRMGSMNNPGSSSPAYRTSKAAVNKIVQCLAADLAREKIAVATLHPGWVKTAMGTAGADIEVGVSAQGIMDVLAGLNTANTGRFWNYDGSSIPW